MSLCGRNVAFPVREGVKLIESEGMDKKSRCFAFELKTSEKGKKNGMPVAIRTRDLLLRRQTLVLIKYIYFVENVAEMWQKCGKHCFCDTLRQNMKQGESTV